MISEEKIKEINDKTDMVALVSEFVTLQKRGKNYFGLCPFHDDESPSFSVSPDKKIAKCMSCGEGGNPVNFLRKVKNISFEQALYELAEKNGIDLPKEDRYEAHVDNNKKYYEMNELAQKYYSYLLWNTKTGQEALEYLHNRGLTDETIKEFKIGLAPKERDLLYKMLKDKGYSDLEISENALVKSGNNGFYDIFNNRVMFPIIDDQNRVLGFSGRIYYKSETEPRYVNSTDSPVYQKGLALFNINNAISHIRKKKRIVLCEGQMDVIALSNAGIGEAVCSLGTALTTDQAKLISKYTKKVIVCYDGDSAGRKATIKAFNILKDFEVTAVCLPNGADPDEFLKANGKEALENYINNKAIDKYEYQFNEAFRDKDLTNAYEYETVKKTVFDMVVLMKSVALQEKYLQRLSNTFKIDYDAIFNDYNIYIQKGLDKPYKKPEETVIKEENILPHEKECLALILMDYNNFLFYKRELGDLADYLSSSITLKMYTAIEYSYNVKFNIKNTIGQCYNDCNDTKFVDEILTYVQEFSLKTPEVIEKMLNDSAKRFIERRDLDEIRDLKVVSNDPTEDVVAKLQKKLELKRKSVKK